MLRLPQAEEPTLHAWQSHSYETARHLWGTEITQEDVNRGGQVEGPQERRHVISLIKHRGCPGGHTEEQSLDATATGGQ